MSGGKIDPVRCPVRVATSKLASESKKKGRVDQGKRGLIHAKDRSGKRKKRPRRQVKSRVETHKKRTRSGPAACPWIELSALLAVRLADRRTDVYKAQRTATLPRRGQHQALEKRPSVGRGH